MIIHDVPQNTPEWEHLRAGKPTASAASRLVTSVGLPSDQLSDYAFQLAIEKYKDAPIGDFGGNKFTDRGHEMEVLARSAYQQKKGVLTTSVGFCTDNMMQYGCSPDDFVGEDGIAEYKAKTDKLHMAVIYNYMTFGKVPTEYIAQPQMLMYVTKRDWCDLVFFHPDLPGLIIRMTPDRDWVRVLKRQLKAVILERNQFYEQMQGMEWLNT